MAGKLLVTIAVAASALAAAAIEEVPFSTLDPAHRNQVRPAGHCLLDRGSCPTFLTTPRPRAQTAAEREEGNSCAQVVGSLMPPPPPPPLLARCPALVFRSS